MDMILGSALKYGDDINTDIISPPQYMELPIVEASAYAMQAVDPDFAKRVKKGGLLRCGEKPRLRFEPLTFKYLGVSCVIAESFARIFYRNCINVGIPALFCAEAYRIHDGDELRVNVEAGRIENLTQGETYVCEKLPAHILRIDADARERQRGERIHNHIDP